MGTTFYTQHELTQAEIDREAAKNAAIAKNRARGAIKRKNHTPQQMTEMRHFDDLASDAAKGRFEGLLSDCRTIAPDVYAAAAPWWAGVRDTITKKDISTAINRMKVRITEAKNVKTEPFTPATSNTLDSMRVQVSADSARDWRNQAPRDKFEDVPNGYYAMDTEEGHLAFYRVSTWKSGDRKVQVQASDELHPVKGRKAADAILAKVRNDGPEVAGLRYAREIGNCWRCGRTLTDEVSRARGIGPVCINR